MTKFQTVAKVSVGLAVALMPALVLAQLTAPVSPFTGPAVTLDVIEDVIGAVAKFLIVVSVVIAVIFIVWGGISYMSAGDDSSKTSAAKSRIVNGIIGALVVLAVGLILQTLASLVDWTTFFGI